MKPFGASGACDELWPHTLTPRFSAVSTTALGPSTWQVITSHPASIKALTASASRTGNDQSPVKMTCTTALGLVDFAPSMKELMLLSTIEMGFAATKPILLHLVESPAATPSTWWAWLRYPKYRPSFF